MNNLLRGPTPPAETTPLTRQAFYQLAEHCRDHAKELARHEQAHVSLKHCHEFNAWLAEIKRYDQLQRPLASLAAAWPIARWQVMVLGAVLGLVIFFSLAGRVDRGVAMLFFYGYFFLVIMSYFMPQWVYGTTIELLEAKVLRVVDALESLLQSGELDLTEAAFFRVKENLEEARRELRQQIDLAHRR